MQEHQTKTYDALTRWQDLEVKAHWKDHPLSLELEVEVKVNVLSYHCMILKDFFYW